MASMGEIVEKATFVQYLCKILKLAPLKATLKATLKVLVAQEYIVEFISFHLH